MKRILLPLGLTALATIFYLTGGVGQADAAKKSAESQISCGNCHADLSAVVPQNHPAVSGKDFAACSVCHTPAPTGQAQTNGFSARLHLAHLPPRGALDCLTCHTWTPDKSFGLIGAEGSWGAPSEEDMELLKTTFQSWSSSSYSDHRHAQAGVVCTSCHGGALPKFDDSVANPRCLECHGPLEKLAKKSANQDMPGQNPHKSHLGEIGCTVCHLGHSASQVYCLSCHKTFNMKLPDGKKK